MMGTSCAGVQDSRSWGAEQAWLSLPQPPATVALSPQAGCSLGEAAPTQLWLDCLGRRQRGQEGLSSVLTSGAQRV